MRQAAEAEPISGVEIGRRPRGRGVRPNVCVADLGLLSAIVVTAVLLLSVSPLEAPLERIRKELAKPPARRLKLDGIQTSVPVFRATVEREDVPSFKALLEKEFRLNDFQRQSQEWSSKCCGLDLIGLVKGVDKYLKKREARKIREQIARELAQIEAASKK